MYPPGQYPVGLDPGEIVIVNAVPGPIEWHAERSVKLFWFGFVSFD